MMQEIALGAVCLGAALLLRHFGVELVRVKGNSMLDTLHSGQVLLVTRPDYRLGRPQRYDVVICHYPNRYADRWKLLRQCFVKRVIALPGETISMEEGIVHINGVPLQEAYLAAEHTRFQSSMEPRTLGEDEYFVMGDNRDRSNDSRRVGAIRRSAMVGKVRLVVWPFRAWKRIG